MANTKKSKSDEAQRKRDQREKDRKLREAESARKHQERKERKAKKDEGLADKAKRAATSIGKALGISSQDAANQRKMRKPKAETQSADTKEGELPPPESPPMFESDDVAALAGYPPEITEEQYENVVRKSALGF